MPARYRPSHVQSGPAGHSAPVHSRRIRRHGRRRLRCVLRVRRDGAHRSGRRHGRAGHVSGQRSDHRRRHSGAEENLADAHCRRGIVVRLRRHGAGSRQRSRCAEDYGGPGHPGWPRRRLQDQRQQTMDQQRRSGRRLHGPGQYAQRSELVHRGKGREGFHPRRTGR